MSTVRIQVRRGLSSEWTTANPVLAAGEMGVETNTNKFKFGNGSSTWTALSYAAADTAAIGEISQDAIDQALSMGAGLTKTYNDGTNTITITVDTAVISTKTFATSEASAARVAAISAAEDYTDAAINGVNSSLSGYLETGDRGTANGVASLDGTGKVPESQLKLTNLTTHISTGGDVTAQNLVVNGSLVVSGTTTTVDTQNVTFADPIFMIAKDNTTNMLDLGFIAKHNDGVSNHTGLVRDASTDKWKLFKGVTTEPGTTVDFTQGSLDTLQLGRIEASTSATINNAEFTGTLAIPSSSIISVAIANGAVTTDKIESQGVTEAKLAANAVVTEKIANSSVTEQKLANNSVTGDKVANSSISTDKIATGSVTDVKLAINSVTSEKIQDNAVVNGKIADGAITETKIANNAVTESKIAAQSITNGKIADAAEIAQSKIAGLGDALDAKAPLSGPTFAGLVVLPESTTIGNVDSTEITYLNGVTSSIQTQFGSAATALSNHASDTTNIHGIEDTSLLATKSYADGAVSTHNDDTTNVHGIADTSLLVTTTGTQTLTNKTLTSPTINGATVGGNIVPSVDNTYDLGSPTNMWKDIYVGPGSLYVNGQKVLQDESGAIVVSADINENLGLRTSGSGNIELDPTGTGVVNVKGPLVIQAATNITSADGNAVTFGGAVSADSISSKTANTDLSLSGNGTGKVYLNDNAEVNGNLVVGGNLTVSGTTTTVNSETISLADNIIDLNSNFSTGTPTENAGIRIVRGDSNAVQIRWNESTDVWEFTNDGSTYSTILSINDTSLTSALNAKLATATAASTYAPIASPTFTGTVTVGANGVVFSDGTQTKAGVPSITTIGTAIGAAYNLSTGGLSLRDQLIPVSGAHTITVPANATTAYPIGTSISFYQSAGADAAFAEASGVTILRTPGLKLRALHSSATITKVATDTWLLAGDLKA